MGPTSLASSRPPSAHLMATIAPFISRARTRRAILQSILGPPLGALAGCGRPLLSRLQYTPRRSALGPGGGGRSHPRPEAPPAPPPRRLLGAPRRGPPRRDQGRLQLLPDPPRA